MYKQLDHIVGSYTVSTGVDNRISYRKLISLVTLKGKERKSPLQKLRFQKENIFPPIGKIAYIYIIVTPTSKELNFLGASCVEIKIMEFL